MWALVFCLTLCLFCSAAGKKTTDEELEEMLESGNPAIFTSGVSVRDLGCTPLLRGAVVGLCAVGEGRAERAGDHEAVGGGPLEGALADGCLRVACCRSLTLRFPSKPSARSRGGTRTS